MYSVALLVQHYSSDTASCIMIMSLLLLLLYVHMVATILLWSYDYTYYHISYDTYYIIMVI